ncbi:MAG: YjgP/YjgQ family permease [Ignavibacteriaceae bacterium]|nr:YjgP/YjgQ family permease [Ignavibacteriaceae bacterium]
MILAWYILKNHLVPFVFASATLMGIFLLQFLMKTADRLVGKGLDTMLIIQLIAYNLAWMVVLVVPMAMLISTLMAFGGMSQNNEVTIMKSSGVSLYRMLLPPVLFSMVIFYGLIVFNNDVLPDANHAAKILMFDISQKKPTLSLEPGVFSQEVTNYAILVRDIDQKTNKLYGVTIYDYNDANKVNVVTAVDGKIYFSRDMTKLIMDLNDGEIHETDIAQSGLYRKLRFTHHRIAMNAEQFSFQQSTPGSSQRGDRELSTADMQIRVDSLEAIRQTYAKMYDDEVRKIFYGDPTIKPVPPNSASPEMRLRNLLNTLHANKNAVVSAVVREQMMQNEIDKYMVEIHKKYSIPFACVVFILLGGPLGVMTRKGGFGVAASVSLFFFLVYWAFLIGGEKLADRGLLSPFMGMWSANILLGVVGIILTYKTAKESVTIDFSSLKRFIPKNWQQQEQEQEQN